ncbi:MAG TPA: beta-ketoacyl synthase N-terminal-like domain-containing protein [Polyangiaceae bacterium]
MSDAAIVAFGAVSVLGEGASAVSAGAVGEPARVGIALDDELLRAGLSRPFAARAALGEVEDRATALLERALASCAAELDRARPGWRRERVGLVLGTSSGGMRVAEAAFAARAAGERIADAEAATYFGPMARAARSLGRPLDPAILVLGACASSVLAIGLAVRCLARGACDVVLAGGFDDVTVFVASGFEALRATTASPPPRPFRLGRDGMSLGEGAAVLALARSQPAARLFVTGFGASSDASHLTAPDREGSGLARAAIAALEEAGRPEIDLVSPHATATPFNDSAEARAVARALSGQRSVPVMHPFKAQLGHTLGAAGALELLACGDAITRGVLPASAGAGALDPDAPARLLDRTETGAVGAALKLASAFGGANAALVLADRSTAVTRRPRPVYVRAASHVATEPSLDALASAARVNVDRLARVDGLVRLALAAVASLETLCGTLAGAGIVVGSALATVETNTLYAARIRERGARAAAPRVFPYTSPNAVTGECSIAFGLTGPSFSVGGGLHAGLEALAAGTLLVEGGDADRVVVVAVDEGGPTTRALAGDAVVPGAVALLLSASDAGAVARVGELHVRRGVAAPGPVAAGHQALLPLLEGTFAGELTAASPPDAVAVVHLERV